jgi:hypothetical protein
MAKTTKTTAELQSMIVSAVRGHPHCEDFRSIQVYRIDDKVDFNWGATNFDPGQAGMESCEAALEKLFRYCRENTILQSDAHGRHTALATRASDVAAGHGQDNRR